MKKKQFIYIGIGAAAVIASVVYYFFIAPPDWRSGAQSAVTGVDKDGHPWIGAQNPELTIHEFLDYDCPHCSAAHKYIRSRIARHLDTIRLVRHDYARTKCILQLGDNRILRCPMVRAAECASKHVSYWEWNDALIAEPRHESGLKHDEYIANMLKKFHISQKEFDKCFNSEEVAEKAQKIYDFTRAARVSVTPTYMIDGKIYNALELIEFLNNR